MKTTIDDELDDVLSSIKSGKIYLYQIPDEFKHHPKVLSLERSLKIRITISKGYDFIRKEFFVNEKIKSSAMENDEMYLDRTRLFDDFSLFYDYLDGDIYENGCYRFYNFSNDVIKKYNLNLEELNKVKYLNNITLEQYNLDLEDKENQIYENAKTVHMELLEWLDDFLSCNSKEDLTTISNIYLDKNCNKILPIKYFYIEYIKSGADHEKRIKDVIDLIFESKRTPDIPSLLSISYLYGYDKIPENFRFNYLSQTTCQRYKNRLKAGLNLLCDAKYFERFSFYDKTNEFFYSDIYVKLFDENSPRRFLCRIYFKDFADIVKYLNNDLSNCIFIDDKNLFINKKDYKTNEMSILPNQNDDVISYEVEKSFDGKKFFVSQRWNWNQKIKIKENLIKFDHFFDFAHFLNDDLTGVDLTNCEALFNMDNNDGLDLSKAIIPADILKKFNLLNKPKEIEFNMPIALAETYNDEINYDVSIVNEEIECKENKISNLDTSDYDLNTFKISYASDLHLMHKIKNNECKTIGDVMFLFNNIASNLLKENPEYLLIAGDVCSDIDYFELFLKVLDKHNNKLETKIIFTLGNHELWPSDGLTLEQKICFYRDLLKKYHMRLLQNELYYSTFEYRDGHKCYKSETIGYEKLNNITLQDLASMLKASTILILGGIGFAGYNTSFNALNGIYMKTLNRRDEIMESKKFERLFNKLLPLLKIKNSIVLTHMPKKDWCKDSKPEQNIIFVNGHTHRNYFYDDGCIRVYSNNQGGYKGKNIYGKTFSILNLYDYLSDYSDGIHLITRDEYRNFYIGRNINITCNRPLHKMYMIKKSGYYMFVHQAKNGNLSIMNGGSFNSIPEKNLSYYFENLDAMVETIKTPMDIYTSYQNKIAKEVKKIGGEGTVHGAIIDIDFFNHLYVNPHDNKITPYHAMDIISKNVYPNIPSLLEDKCPKLFKNFNLLANEEKHLLVPKEIAKNKKGIPYFSTDIYGASRIISKLQKINNNIVCTWNDLAIEKQEKKKGIK